MTRACKLVEASFDPENGSAGVSLPELPPVPTLSASAPMPAEFDLATVAGVEAFVSAVAEYAEDVDAVESKVNSLDDDLSDYEKPVEQAVDDVEPAQTFASFAAESVNRQMELSGFNRCDEVVILLRGDYDRLVHAANEDCACKFDSAGRCIHRGCGLRTVDWVDVAEVEVA